MTLEGDAGFEGGMAEGAARAAGKEPRTSAAAGNGAALPVDDAKASLSKEVEDLKRVVSTQEELLMTYRKAAENLMDKQGTPAMLRVFLKDAKKQSDELKTLFVQSQQVAKEGSSLLKKDLEAQAARYKQHQDVLNLQIANLKLDCGAAEEALGREKKVSEQLRLDKAILEAQIAFVREECEMRIKEKIKEAESAYRDEASKLSEASAALQERLQEQGSRCAQVEAAASKATETALKDLQGMLDRARELRQKDKANAAALLEEKDRELDAFEAELERYKADAASARKAAAALQKRDRELEACKAELERYKADAASARKEAATLEKRDRELEACKAELERCKAEADSAGNAASALEERSRELERCKVEAAAAEAASALQAASALEERDRELEARRGELARCKAEAAAAEAASAFKAASALEDKDRELGACEVELVRCKADAASAREAAALQTASALEEKDRELEASEAEVQRCKAEAASAREAASALEEGAARGAAVLEARVQHMGLCVERLAARYAGGAGRGGARAVVRGWGQHATSRRAVRRCVERMFAGRGGRALAWCVLGAWQGRVEWVCARVGALVGRRSNVPFCARLLHAWCALARSNARAVRVASLVCVSRARASAGRVLRAWGGCAARRRAAARRVRLVTQRTRTRARGRVLGVWREAAGDARARAAAGRRVWARSVGVLAASALALWAGVACAGRCARALEGRGVRRCAHALLGAWSAHVARYGRVQEVGGRAWDRRLRRCARKALRCWRREALLERRGRRIGGVGSRKALVGAFVRWRDEAVRAGEARRRERDAERVSKEWEREREGLMEERDKLREGLSALQDALKISTSVNRVHEREIERLQTGGPARDRRQQEGGGQARALRAYDTPEKRMVRDQEDLRSVMASAAARGEELKAALGQVGELREELQGLHEALRHAEREREGAKQREQGVMVERDALAANVREMETNFAERERSLLGKNDALLTERDALAADLREMGARLAERERSLLGKNDALLAERDALAAQVREMEARIAERERSLLGKNDALLQEMAERDALAAKVREMEQERARFVESERSLLSKNEGLLQQLAEREKAGADELAAKVREMEQERAGALERERGLLSKNEAVLRELSERERAGADEQRRDREADSARERELLRVREEQARSFERREAELERERQRLTDALREKEKSDRVRRQEAEAALDAAVRTGALATKELVEREGELERVRGELRGAQERLRELRKGLAAASEAPEASPASTSDALGRIRSMCAEMDALRKEKKAAQSKLKEVTHAANAQASDRAAEASALRTQVMFLQRKLHESSGGDARSCSSSLYSPETSALSFGHASPHPSVARDSRVPRLWEHGETPRSPREERVKGTRTLPSQKLPKSDKKLHRSALSASSASESEEASRSGAAAFSASASEFAAKRTPAAASDSQQRPFETVFSRRGPLHSDSEASDSAEASSPEIYAVKGQHFRGGGISRAFSSPGVMSTLSASFSSRRKPAPKGATPAVGVSTPEAMQCWKGATPAASISPPVDWGIKGRHRVRRHSTDTE